MCGYLTLHSHREKMECSVLSDQGWKTLKFGTWNVRGLTEKKSEVVAEIERENEDIVVLTETKLKGTGSENLGNYVHFYSGTQEDHVWAGVSILIKKELKSPGLRWDTINERFIRLKLKVCELRVVVVGAYWSDEPLCKRRKKELEKAENEDTFVTDLRNILRGIKDNEELILLGDFNAWTGIKVDDRIVGEFGENEVNTKGRRLLELCSEFRLKIQNSFFHHEDIHKYTFYKPHSSSKSVIDYCITRQISSFKVQDVIACRWLECETDHIFLESTILFPSKSSRNPTRLSDKTTLERSDYKNYFLYSKTLRASYKKYLEHALDISVERTTEETYQHLKESIHSSAKRVLGFKNVEKIDEFLWDREIRELRGGEENNNNFISDKKLNAQRIKNEVWTGICSAIDKNNRYTKNTVVWSILNDFQKKISDDLIPVNKDLIVPYIKKCFTESRSKFNSFPNFEETPGDDIYIPVDRNDILMALDDLDETPYLSPGGLKSNLLKYSSSTTRRLLRSLIQDIFSGASIPVEINEMYIYIVPNRQYDIKRSRSKWASECTVQVVHPIKRIMGTILKKKLETIAVMKPSSTSQESPLDIKFILRMILQKHCARQNEPLHLAVLDLTQTYADVPLSELLNTLQAAGVGRDFMKIIKYFIGASKVRIVTPDEVSDSFPISKGLKRDCSLTSTFYEMYVEEHIKEWAKETSDQGIRIGNRHLSYFFSNGKLVLLNKKKEDLELALVKLKDRFKIIGLKIIPNMIQYLGNDTLKLGREKITGKSTIDYEGTLLELDGRNEEDICHKILDAKKAIGLLHPVARDDTIMKNTKKRIFYSVIKNLLMYGCETWTLMTNWKGRRWENYIDDVELRYWKWCCAGHSGKREIYESMGIYYDICNLIMLRKAAWYAEVKQGHTNEWPKFVLEWEPEGQKKHCRPRKKWMDGLEDFIEQMQIFHKEKSPQKLFAKE